MTASVPDSDSLRRAALQASWQRGRWVARRRLWWRWTAYVLLRFGLPVAALLGLIAGLIHGWSVMTRTQTPSTTAPPAGPPAVEPEPAPAGNANSASLRLDWALSARNRPKANPAPAASSPAFPPATTTTTNIGEPRP